MIEFWKIYKINQSETGSICLLSVTKNKKVFNGLDWVIKRVYKCWKNEEVDQIENLKIYDL